VVVLHKIGTDRDGNIKVKNLTPGKAIRKHCLQCVGTASEIRNCGGDKLIGGGSCPLYPYRLGKGRPSVKIIRGECLYCMGGSYELVRNCENLKCNLFDFRMGTNPNYGRREYVPERVSQEAIFA
jgi:hypothetical protein